MTNAQASRPRPWPLPSSEPHSAVGLVVLYDPTNGDGLVQTKTRTTYKLTRNTRGLDFARLTVGCTVECHAANGGGVVTHARVLACEPLHPMPPASQLNLLASPSSFTTPEERSRATLAAADLLRTVCELPLLPQSVQKDIKDLMHFFPKHDDLVQASQRSGYFAAPSPALASSQR